MTRIKVLVVDDSAVVLMTGVRDAFGIEREKPPFTVFHARAPSV
jgi:hypothetical protein